MASFGTLGRRLAIAVALLSASGVSRADTVLSLAGDKLSERYAENAQVSGNQLVGLMYVSPSEQFQIGAMRVAIPPTSPKQLCLAVTTRDGRYLAINPYKVGQNASGTMAQPEFETEYQDELASYQSSDVAIAAALADDCTSIGDRTYVVATLAGQSGQIIVKANTLGLKTKAVLTDESGNKELVEATCTPPAAGPLITYDSECVLDVPTPSPARAKLILIRRKATGGLSSEPYKLGFTSVE